MNNVVIYVQGRTALECWYDDDDEEGEGKAALAAAMEAIFGSIK